MLLNHVHSVIWEHRLVKNNFKLFVYSYFFDSLFTSKVNSSSARSSRGGQSILRRIPSFWLILFSTHQKKFLWKKSIKIANCSEDPVWGMDTEEGLGINCLCFEHYVWYCLAVLASTLNDPKGSSGSSRSKCVDLDHKGLVRQALNSPMRCYIKSNVEEKITYIKRK